MKALALSTNPLLLCSGQGICVLGRLLNRCVVCVLKMFSGEVAVRSVKITFQKRIPHVRCGSNGSPFTVRFCKPSDPSSSDAQ
jgi:hypothetical protein